jgi:hypothetical protein
MPRCEKTDPARSAYFGILKRFLPVKSFHDSHITEALQVFPRLYLVQMFWIKRRRPVSDQGLPDANQRTD